MNWQPDQQPECGVTDRYLGESGREYFAWQSLPLNQGQYNTHIWNPYVRYSDEVLDFGCGGGFLLKALQARRKVGVEINPHARAYAADVGLEVYKTVEEVPGKYDKIITSHVLEHLPHPTHAVLDLKKKLRGESSRLLVLVPIDNWRTHANRRYRPDNRDMHLYTWTPQSLGNLLASCGLRVLDMRVIRHAWPPKHETLWRISPRLFHGAALLWSVLNRRYQLFAVAALSASRDGEQIRK